MIVYTSPRARRSVLRLPRDSSRRIVQLRVNYLPRLSTASKKISFKLILWRLGHSEAMFRKISGSIGAILILVVLFPNVRSNPIDSGNIFRRVSKAGNFQRKPVIAGPVRRLFCLDESAIARLSEIADIQVSPPNGRQVPPTECDNSDGVRKILEFKPRKFRCEPIEDVFISAVERKVPAYTCKLHGRRFIISSERFHEDFKNHLEIDVDETTFRRLAVDDGTNMVNTVADVIPVTLTQSRGEEFYGVKSGRNWRL